MTLTKKLGIAVVVGGAMGMATHWLVGAVAFALAACAVTLSQIRHEVHDLRSLVDEEEAAMSIPPSSLQPPSSSGPPSSIPVSSELGTNLGSSLARDNEHESHAAAT